MFIQPGDRSMVVYERGCLRAGEEWVEVNLLPVAGVAVGIAILQVPPVFPFYCNWSFDYAHFFFIGQSHGPMKSQRKVSGPFSHWFA